MLVCACVQMRSSDDPVENLETARSLIQDAAAKGAQFVATPEMTGLMDIRKGRTREYAQPEQEDAFLAALRDEAKSLGIWLLIGSLAVKTEASDDDRLANRSFLINPTGEIIARYDKIHMFDVDVGDGQSYRESRAYRPGDHAVLAPTPFGGVGMTICYDLRFPYLYRMLAQSGADIITVPAAFTKVTGQAHWHALLKARAIETGCYVIAPAQGGKHADGRETFGCSLIISPWGDILAEGGVDPGVFLAELDLNSVKEARRKIPSFAHDRAVAVTRNAT